MYICPICNESFETETDITKHSLKCWREQNPYHQSKPAPRSENIEERKINSEMSDFFSSLQKRVK